MEWRIHLVVLRHVPAVVDYPSIMKCCADIRKDLYAKVMLFSGVAMFQGIGEQMAKECNVSYDRVFASVTVSVEVSLGTKLAKLRGGLECT